jgi:hypothetical protein
VHHVHRSRLTAFRRARNGSRVSRHDRCSWLGAEAALASEGIVMKKDRKRIALGRETVRHLSPGTLEGIGGGAINLSRHSQCDCPTFGGCGPNTLTVSAVRTACTVTKDGDCQF